MTQSPKFDCQSVKAETTAVSARKIRGPRLIEKVFGFCIKQFFSFLEKPPSGPMNIAQGPFGRLEKSIVGFNSSSLQKKYSYGLASFLVCQLVCKYYVL